MARLSHRIDCDLLTTHGLEGIAGLDLSLADAEMMARAFASYLMKQSLSRVAVCFDGSPATPELAAAAMSGLQRCGVEVQRLGAGSLPLLAYAQDHRVCDAGILVCTNPLRPERQALRFYVQGLPLARRQTKELAEMAADGTLLKRRGRMAEVALAEDYLGSLLDLWPTGARGLTVVWDHGNGATAPIVEGLTRRLQGRHLLLSEAMVAPRGRPGEAPPAKNPADRLGEVMRDGAFDLGFSFDCLGERMVALDAKAEPVAGKTVAEAMRLRDKADMTDPLQLAVLICGRQALNGSAEADLLAAGPH